MEIITTLEKAKELFKTQRMVLIKRKDEHSKLCTTYNQAVQFMVKDKGERLKLESMKKSSTDTK